MNKNSGLRTLVRGVRFSGTSTGLKGDKLDLGLVFFENEMNVLSAYTRNKVKAAHILYNKRKEAAGVRALVANSGCANACTGKEGLSDLALIAETTAENLTIPQDRILFASTGVIGKRLSLNEMARSIPQAAKDLKPSHFDRFAQAIMTTDTHPKVATETVAERYTIVGIAKGSGMISPQFATMLAFVFTDFPVPVPSFRRSFNRLVRESFERITVDGECSTNDTVLLFSPRGSDPAAPVAEFTDRLRLVMNQLSMMVVRDGEGATRVIHIIVQNARSQDTAEQIARRIANSPLCKTAFFGCDPNWGRIIAAAGDAGVPVEQGKIEISLQGRVLARNGVEVPFDETEMKEIMDSPEVEVIVDLHEGRSLYDIYTTDLTYDYIKINASYRT